MNTINYAPGHILFPLGDIPITINGAVYKHLTVVARLLTPGELKRIEATQTRGTYEKEVTNDNIFSACVVDILGIHEPVDLDSSSAGLVTMVAEAIYNMSIMHVINAVGYATEYEEKITLLDTMAAVISRFLNISYLEVSKMPINRIFELYATCRKAFPSHVSAIVEEELEESARVGVND